MGMTYQEILEQICTETSRHIPPSARGEESHHVAYEGNEDSISYTESPEEDLTFIIFSYRDDSSNPGEHSLFCPMPSRNDDAILAEYLRRQIVSGLHEVERQEFESILVLTQSSSTYIQTDVVNGAILLPCPIDEYAGLVLKTDEKNCVTAHSLLIDKQSGTYAHNYAQMYFEEGKFYAELDINSSRLPYLDSVKTAIELYDCPLAPDELDKSLLMPLPKGNTYKGNDVWIHSTLEYAAILFNGNWIPTLRIWLLSHADAMGPEIANEVNLYKNLIQ